MLSMIAFQNAEAVSWKCPIKKMFLKVSENSEAATGGAL